MERNPELKSKEEFAFAAWIDELLKIGVVQTWKYEPVTFTLAKSKRTTAGGKQKHLCRGCVYTPDFSFFVATDFQQKFEEKTGMVMTPPWPEVAKGSSSGWFLVETKGQKPRQADTFSIKMKWLLETKKLYVNKVIPIKLFQKTFVPENRAIDYCYGIRGNLRKPFTNCMVGATEWVG